MFCTKCGKQIDDDSIFCAYCGANLTEAQNIGASDSTPEPTVEQNVNEADEDVFIPEPVSEPVVDETPAEPVAEDMPAEPVSEPVADEPREKYQPAAEPDDDLIPEPEIEDNNGNAPVTDAYNDEPDLVPVQEADPDKRVCSNCGYELDETDKFCYRCGAPVTAMPVVENVSEPAAETTEQDTVEPVSAAVSTEQPVADEPEAFESIAEPDVTENADEPVIEPVIDDVEPEPVMAPVVEEPTEDYSPAEAYSEPAAEKPADIYEDESADNSVYDEPVAADTANEYESTIQEQSDMTENETEAEATPIQKKPVCAICGFELSGSDKFCYKCGSPIEQYSYSAPSDTPEPENKPADPEPQTQQYNYNNEPYPEETGKSKGLIIIIIILAVLLVVLLAGAGVFLAMNPGVLGLNGNNAASDSPNYSTVISREYDVSGDLVTWNATEYEYDERGNCTIARSSDGVTKYYYYNDEDLKYLYTVEDDNSEDDYWVECEYDSDGNMIKATYYSPDGHISHWSEYEYDKSGNQTKRTNYYTDDADGYIDSWFEFDYDSSDNLETKTKYKSDGSIKNWTEYEYDDEGNLEVETVYDSDGNVTKSYKYKYDDGTPDPVKKSIYGPDGSMLGWIEYEYVF